MNVDIFNKQQFRAFKICSSSRLKMGIVYSFWALSGLLVTGLGMNLSFSNIFSKGLILLPAWFFLTLAIYVLNDMYDREFDKLIDREQPLVTGEVNPTQAMVVISTFVALAITLSAIVNISALAVSLIFLIIGTIYSIPPIQIKRRILGKQFTLTSLFLLSILAGGVAIRGFPSALFFMILCVGPFLVLMTPIPDLKDMESDKKQGCKTVPLLLGPNISIDLGILAFLSLSTLSILGYLVYGFNLIFVISIVILSFINFHQLLKLRYGNQNRTNYIKARQKAWIAGILLPLMFIIGVV
ncbi:hypothetical protein AKJ38_02395 [candidate division MSBL1 archaeon SCGC-AAA259I14]|uniref:Prenyltransferase n=1 Tax=candidate division MSBL1 archaeon SCGC-AAA259I14 TaxID=1698268 RepID=A0A133URL7_9EURY|nr:hypothetical protein AKJ38_02395 [candidate division MSBL1 archaeon SCGC-AAA259I14]